MLAGVAWPFPIIFTGGVVPGLWRPIVGIDAFDLREDEIDITPFLPILCDGNSHNFTLRVSGLVAGDDGSIVLSETPGSFWLVDGKAFVWLDSENHTTTGTVPVRDTPSPHFSIASSVGTGTNGTNETLNYQVTAQRQLSISSTIRTSQGEKAATWTQSLAFSNTGSMTDAGNIQINQQNTSGVDFSSCGYVKRFSYPLWVETGYHTLRDINTITADITRGKRVDIAGEAVFPTGIEPLSLNESFQGAALSTTQSGKATYIANDTSSTAISFGTTSQDVVLTGLRPTNSTITSGFPIIQDRTEIFHRRALAVNGTVLEDEETYRGTIVPHAHTVLDSGRSFAEHGVRAMIGRGPTLAGLV